MEEIWVLDWFSFCSEPCLKLPWLVTEVWIKNLHYWIACGTVLPVQSLWTCISLSYLFLSSVTCLLWSVTAFPTSFLTTSTKWRNSRGWRQLNLLFSSWHKGNCFCRKLQLTIKLIVLTYPHPLKQTNKRKPHLKHQFLAITFLSKACYILNRTSATSAPTPNF